MTATHTTPRSKYRPRGDGSEQVQIQFRLTASLRRRVRAEAARRGVSVNYLVERALVDGLDKWEKQKLV